MVTQSQCSDEKHYSRDDLLIGRSVDPVDEISLATRLDSLMEFCSSDDATIVEVKQIVDEQRLICHAGEE